MARVAVGRSGAPRSDEVWMGGVPADRGAPRIHPQGFYSPVREGLGRAYPPVRWRALPRPAWVLPAVDLDRWGYTPITLAGRRIVAMLRRLHTGIPTLYLAWQLVGAAALAALLLMLRR
jgi:hypothetical protein